MNVFLTGGTGYVGSYLVLELLRRGHHVTLLARNPGKIPALRSMEGVSFVEGDLEDIDAIRRGLKGQNACIHNAIVWDEEPTELQMKDTRAANLVFEAAAEAGVEQTIYTSSTAVHRPFRPHMDEEQRLTPMDFYAAIKAAGEAFLSAFSYQTTMRCNVVRAGPVVGGPALPGAPVNGDRRFKAFVDAAREGKDIRLGKHDGRQFIHAADLARVYGSLLESNSNRQTYLAVAREYVLWEEIAHLAVDLCRSNSQIIVEERGVDETPNLFDAGKIKRDFGLEFEYGPAIREHLLYLIGSAK